MRFVNAKQRVALRVPEEFAARCGTAAELKNGPWCFSKLTDVPAYRCTHEINLSDTQGITG